MGGMLTIGITGLSAAQTGLLTTSHNISNAATPGYSRQEVIQSTNEPQFTGSGFLGQGTNVQTVRRVYSQFLGSEVLGAETRSQELQTYANEINKIDNMLADTSAGLSPSLQEFFRGIQDMAANPSLLPSRQAMLSSGQALVARFQSLNSRMKEIRDGVNEQITASITAINSLAAQVAQINQRISQSNTGAIAQPNNDLLDQRDKLIADLNKELRVTTTTESDGSFNVFVGNGQPLVIGGQSFGLAATQDDFDATKTVVSYKSPSGTVELQESLLSGGTLGGLLAFRRESLDPAQNALGRTAITLAQTFNNQHALGQDLTGALGSAFFSVGAPNVSANNNNTGTGVLSAQIIESDYRVSVAGGNYTVVRLSDSTSFGPFGALPQTVDGVTISLSSGAPANGDVFIVKPENVSGQRVIPESDNTGTAVLGSTGSNLGALTTSDYRVDYDGANYVVQRLSDSTTVGTFATLPQTVDGVTLSVTGVPVAGDSFLVQPTRLGARDIGVAISDPRAIAAAAPFRTAASNANTGTAEISAGQVDSRANLPLPANVTLTYVSGTTSFTVAGAVPAVGSIAYTSGNTISFNGLSFSISGTPSNGDVFTLSANTNGVSDNRNAVQLGSLQTKNILVGGTANYQSSYSQLVSETGNKSREIRVTLTAQESLVDQTKNALQSLSGVNLDEEAANLLRYQQAFQASGKVIEIAGRLFETVLSLGR